MSGTKSEIGHPCGNGINHNFLVITTLGGWAWLEILEGILVRVLLIITKGRQLFFKELFFQLLVLVVCKILIL
jgi:hypothetical protein